MAQENLELVRTLLERFAAGEILWDALDEEIEIHDHDILDAGTYRGHAGVVRWAEDWGAGLPIVSFEAQEFLELGEAVVAVILLKARGRGSSVDIERQDAIVYRFRGARIASFHYYNSKQQALDAVGAKA